MVSLDNMVKNILENTVYIEPQSGLLVPDGMCKGNKDCADVTATTKEIILDTDKLKVEF